MCGHVDRHQRERGGQRVCVLDEERVPVEEAREGQHGELERPVSPVGRGEEARDALAICGLERFRTPELRHHVEGGLWNRTNIAWPPHKGLAACAVAYHAMAQHRITEAEKRAWSRIRVSLALAIVSRHRSVNSMVCSFERMYTSPVLKSQCSRG